MSTAKRQKYSNKQKFDTHNNVALIHFTFINTIFKELSGINYDLMFCEYFSYKKETSSFKKKSQLY